MTKNELNKLTNIVKGSNHILLLQPDRPDIDSLGAALALKISFEATGKTATIYCPRPLKGAEEFLFGSYITDAVPKFDSTLLVDTPNENQISVSLKNLKKQFKQKPFVIIDHHPEMEGWKFADLKIIEYTEPAAASLVFKIIRELNWEFNKESARAILLAYLYDTRKLMIPKVTPGTLRDVADILEISGVSISDINREYDVAYGLDPETYRKKAKVIRKVKYYDEGKIAIYTINRRLSKWLKNRGSLSEYVKYELQQGVRGVLISVGISEGKKVVGITMRANIPIANKVAEQFGGGGHALAAGARIFGVSARRARKMLAPVIKTEIERYTKENPDDPALQHSN